MLHLNKITLYLLLIVIMTSSCYSIAIKLLVDKSIHSQLTTLKSEDNKQTIVLLPMVHIGTKEYYDGVKKVIDSLHQQDYIAFYEGLEISENTDSLTLDTLARKLRKILRMNIMTGYGAEENKSIPKAVKNKKYIAQSNKYLGIDPSRGDTLVDLELNQLLKLYEEEYGKIELTDCDYTTGLLEKYKCKKDKKLSKRSIHYTYRDANLLEALLHSPKKKIMVIYGKGHMNWIVAKLTNKGYTMTQKGKCIY